ncbi:MAG: dihydrodipicolinate synthase family protein [Cyclobacteriaceae bacterium]
MEWSRRKFINAGIAGSLGVFSISAGIKWPSGKRKLPGGFWPVMMTPFNEDLSIDYTGLKHLIRWYEEAGSQGLFANCASSEMYQLSPEERIELTRFVVKNSNVPVVSTGTFYDDVDKNVEFIRKINQTGVDAVVIIPSVIVGKEKSDQDMMEHFGALIDKTSDIPLGIYECPSPYRRLIEPDKLEQLTKSDRFLYFKDTSCDELLVEEKIKVSADSSLGIYNAHSPDVLHSIRHGGAGISCIAGNFYPELFSYLWKEGRTETVSPSVKKVNDFILANDRVIGNKYSIAAKYFMKLRGLPVTVASRKSKQVLDASDKDRLDQLWSELRELGEGQNIEIV